MKSEWTEKPVGGNYFHPQVGNKTYNNILLRDCVGLGNNCSYEVIVNTEEGVHVSPIEGDWRNHGLITHYIDRTPK